MYCKKCGSDMGNDKFCPNCGEPAAGGERKADPHYAPDQKTVNKIAYGLIAIILGGIGIHRFYAGKWISGILYILFFWTAIPGILGFIEGIVALCRNSDQYGNIPVYPDKFFV